MESNLQGKTVLLVEAARNFGEVTAHAMAREGANLFLSTLDDQGQAGRRHGCKGRRRTVRHQ
jgi:NAD(P)-dependent dehydrogenase (short-subunit alcohol dehydrogenase family)